MFSYVEVGLFLFYQLRFFYLEINDCIVNPCINGGKCTDLIADYRCDCPVGFIGRNCKISKYLYIANFSPNMSLVWPATWTFKIISNFLTDIDDCNPNPCLNEGSCADKIDDFMCDCKAGFMGKTCSNGKDADSNIL